MKEDASSAKRFLKFRNAHNKKSTDDLVKDYESKGGKVKKGPTEPMSDALRYKKPTKAATVNVAALKDPAAVSSARRKKETNSIVKKLGGAKKVVDRLGPDHHLLKGKGAFVEDVTLEGKTFRGGDYKSNMAKRLLKAAQKTKRDQSELKRTVAEGEDSTPLRHVKTYSNEKTGHGAKIYRDRDWDEYRVKHFKNGSHQKDADYHTSDRDDAHDQAKYWTGPDHEKKTHKEEVVIDELSKRLLNRYRTKASDATSGRQVMMPGKTRKNRDVGLELAKNKIGFTAKVVAREEVEEISETSMAKIKDHVHADTYGRDKEGNHVFRRSFFYSGGGTSEKFANRVSKNLDDAGIKHHVVDHGEHNAPFRGGASVRNQSHWWAKVKIHKDVKEDVDAIDETSGMKLRRYIDASDKEDRLVKKAKKHGDKAADRSGDLYLSAIDKLRKSSQAADSRLREDNEELDEVSQKLLRSYKEKARAQHSEFDDGYSIKAGAPKRVISKSAQDRGPGLANKKLKGTANINARGVKRVAEGKTWKAAPGDTYAAKKLLRDRIKNSTQIKKDAEARRKIEETRMPKGVIAHKQRLDSMTDSEFAVKHKDRSDDELRSMAWRLGYGKGSGKGSDHFVQRRKRGLSEGWPEVRSLNKKKRPSKTKAKIEPTGIR